MLHMLVLQVGIPQWETIWRGTDGKISRERKRQLGGRCSVFHLCMFFLVAKMARTDFSVFLSCRMLRMKLRLICWRSWHSWNGRKRLQNWHLMMLLPVLSSCKLICLPWKKVSKVKGNTWWPRKLSLFIIWKFEYINIILSLYCREKIKESSNTLKDLEEVHNKYLKRQEVSGRSWSNSIWICQCASNIKHDLTAILLSLS